MSASTTAVRHRVDVEKSGDWWAITVPALRGVFSQAKSIDEVPSQAREAIALMLDVEPAEVGAIDVHVKSQPGSPDDPLGTSDDGRG